MQVDDGGQELPHDGGGFTLRQLASRNDIVKQLTATNIAHDNVQGVFILHTRGYHRQETRVSIELLLFFAAGGVCVSPACVPYLIHIVQLDNGVVLQGAQDSNFTQQLRYQLSALSSQLALVQHLDCKQLVGSEE